MPHSLHQMQIFHHCKAGCRQNLPGELKVLKHILPGIAGTPPSFHPPASSRCARWRRDDRRLRGFDHAIWLVLMTGVGSGHKRQKGSPLKEGRNSSWCGVEGGCHGVGERQQVLWAMGIQPVVERGDGILPACSRPDPQHTQRTGTVVQTFLHTLGWSGYLRPMNTGFNKLQICLSLDSIPFN